MNCKCILTSFLQELDISKSSYENALEKVIISQSKEDACDITYKLGYETIINILINTYALNSENVKKCAEIIKKNYSAIGRSEKELIKHFLDYNDEESLTALFQNVQPLGIPKIELEKIIKACHIDYTQNAKNSFFDNWKLAEKNDDENKKFDYLQGIYTRLFNFFNENALSLHEIFEYNSKFIVKELDFYKQDELKSFCNDTKKINKSEARRIFCDKYNEILIEDLKEKSINNKLEAVMNLESCAGTPFNRFFAEQFGLVVIDINQEMYNLSIDEIDFYDKVLSLLYYSYRILDNHKTLALNINNIYTPEGKNLKWLLYSYIGIYAEHFLPTVEKRKFYKPEKLCRDKCAYMGIDLTFEQAESIEKYFNKKIDRTELKKLLDISDSMLNDILMDFECVWYGYTFSDCISVISGSYRQNSEISFIENNNQLIYIFNKYRHDDRKIPCPDCAGLNISGNSFPEIGLRSWECNNVICPSRSKSNRGKRYSKKSNFMQSAFENGNANDIISKNLIQKWRRDIVEVESQYDIYYMLVKYFSFDNDEILFINPESCIENIDISGRRFETVSLEAVSGMEIRKNEFKKYFENGNYVKRYIFNSTDNFDADIDEDLNAKIKNLHGAGLIRGESFSVLKKINSDTFTAAVTSPPYYNARFYSQWSNLYLYLADMYKIICQTFRTMKEGGIYLYNIGDICDNENTVTSSTMGDKRILLGAYTIHLFVSAGFELLDNILWDKGEPQSNRHKNDGKYTPYYQKPMNVYEHMFIFKKPGKPAIVKKNIFDILPLGWNKNIVKFKPVIKINCKGENILGHTAPFPSDIPNFVAKCFTKNQSDIILEPFAGSGTSLIASSKCGVNSLGVELCEEYVRLIQNIAEDNNIKITKI